MPYPSPAELAEQILDARESRYFRHVLPDIIAMATLDRLSDDAGYKLVAAVRQGLGRWRTNTARVVKHDLDTLLTHYRVDQWR